MLRPNSKKQLIVLVEYLSSADLSFFFFFFIRGMDYEWLHTREKSCLLTNTRQVVCCSEGG